MSLKVISYALIGAIVLILGVATYRYATSPARPLIFSPTQVLSSSWAMYKKLYVDPDTQRTIDRQRGGITTSEGQSYTMLRAVWQGDQPAFDASWQWTRERLARKDDHLFSWLWGEREDGTFGVLSEQGGHNSASDADTDIALALVFAYARWQDPAYLEAARPIIRDIWDKEVVLVAGKPVLAANSVEKTASSTFMVVNPSYLHPAAYHIFASIDTGHPWETLRSHAYALLRESAELALEGKESAGLPPDWVLINRSTGEMMAPAGGDQDTSFGYDALRVPFRIALDAAWFRNPDATALLKKFSFLSSEWEQDRKLAASYAHDGAPEVPSESLAMYGGTLGYFLANDPEAAVHIYNEKMLPFYDAYTGGWSPQLSYYDDNWMWFGIALYNGQLRDLTAHLPSTAFIE